MRKKVFSGVFALALLAIAGFGLNRSMKSDANLSDLALKNVLALADVENPDTGEGGGGDGGFNCSVIKDECKPRVTINLIPILKEKFNLNVSLGVTVDLTDFTKVYTAPLPNKARVRCGVDVYCNDLLN